MKSAKRRLFIHIGHEKCGSKSIQLFMRDHREALEEKGYFSPVTTKVVDYDMGLGAFAGRSALKQEYVSWNKVSSENATDLNAYIERELLKECSDVGAPNLVLSFEGLLNAPREGVHDVAALLKKLADDVRVLAIVRRQDRWAVSAYSTRLITGGATRRNDLKDHHNEYFAEHYYDRVQAWEEALGAGSVRVVALEDTENVVDAFQGFLGVQVADDTRRANQSISAYSQEILRQFNAALPDHPEWAARAQEIRLAILPLLPKGAPKLPSRKAVEEMLKFYEQDNHKLREAYLGQDSAFFAEMHDYPDEDTPTVIRHKEMEDWVDLAFAKLQSADQ